MEIIKEQRAIDRLYKYTIISHKKIETEDLTINDWVKCISCDLVGQYYFQKGIQMYYYCPKCGCTWAIIIEDLRR